MTADHTIAQGGAAGIPPMRHDDDRDEWDWIDEMLRDAEQDVAREIAQASLPVISRSAREESAGAAMDVGAHGHSASFASDDDSSE